MSEQDTWHPEQSSAEQVMRLLEDAKNPSGSEKQKELYNVFFIFFYSFQ